jgi:rubredoxin
MRFYKIKISLFWILFSLGLLIVVVYPIFTYEYLFHDDWHNFMANCPWRQWGYLLGRPLAPVIACFQFDLFQSIKDAYLARIVSFLGVAALFVAIYEFLRREDYPESLSAFIAFGCVTLPGALVTAYYLSAGFIAFSFLASVIAALLGQVALKQIATDKGPYVFMIASGFMQIVSASIYQTGAMFFLVCAAAAMAHSFKRRDSLLIRSSFVYGIIFIAANLIYFSVFKYFVGAELAQRNVRGIFFSQTDSSFIWFFQTVLPRALNLWFIGESAVWIQMLTGFFFFASLLLYIISILHKEFNRRKIFLGISYVIVILLMGIVCFSPVLISAYRWDIFRNLVPLSSFIIAVTCVHLWLVYPRLKQHVSIVILIVSAMLFITFISHNVLFRMMILPKSAEVSYIKDVMWKAKASKQDNFPVHIVIPWIKDTWGTEEIGLLSTSFYAYGDLYSMISHVRRELKLPEVPMTYNMAGDYFNAQDIVVVDISTITNAGLSGLEGMYEKKPPKPGAAKKYICLSCGHVYDPVKGDPAHGIVPGTDYKDVPDSWPCPVCKSRQQFHSISEQ